MKKVTFFALCFAGLLTACGDDSSKDVCSSNDECGHGTCSNSECVCDGLFKLDDNGFCTQCIDGYVNNGSACIKNTTTCSTDDVCGIGGKCSFNNAGTKVCQCKTGFIMGTDNKCSTCDTSAGYKLSGNTCSKESKPNGGEDGNDDKCKNVDCGTNGTCSKGVCKCNTGYTIGDDSKCSACDSGYKPNGSTCEFDADSCVTTFTYYNEYANAENNVSGVYLVGDFNDWLSPDASGKLTNFDDNWKMTSDGNGKWTIDVKLPVDGTYSYKYYVHDWANDAWKTDAADGSSDGKANICKCGMSFGYGGNSSCSTPCVGDECNTDIPDTCDPDAPFDWHDAVLYFAFTDRFYNGNTNNDRKSGVWQNSSAADWYGGDFAGLKQKVEEGYFDKLGVNTLWISSVTKNTDATSEGTNGDTHNYSAYHSYWPICAFRTDQNASDFGDLPAIEDHFGTMEELQELVEACHKRCIRVIVDFAANHVFKDSPMVAKHRDWFNDLDNPQLCDNNNNWDNYSEKCWFSQDLPDINYENAEARRTMVDHAIWLINQTNIDGFRVDAVKHMHIDFIKDLRRAVDGLNKKNMFYMVGETFTDNVPLLNKYIGNDLLHAQFDFPLYYKIKNVLQGYGFYDLAHNFNVQYNSDLMGTFMGNHDVSRALSVAANDGAAVNNNKWTNLGTPDNWVPYFRVKLAWTILLTRPGVPLIYYGDEAGMPGGNDPDNRRMMIFGNDLNTEQQGILDYVSKLGHIRKAHPATRYGTRQDIVAENDSWCYIMKKDADEILVAIATDGDGYRGCNLKTEYTLINLLSDEHEEVKLSNIDMSTNKLNVFQVKH